MENPSIEILEDEAYLKVKTIFSKDKKYRYFLKKTWDDKKGNIVFLMLNPSKADLIKSDNTVTNATNYAVDKDFGSITIVNLFAFMDTDKKSLKDRDKETDKLNDKYILFALKECDELVIAWERGTHKKRKREVAKILKKFPEKLRCFVEYDEQGGYTKVHHLRIFRDIWEYEIWEPEIDLEVELQTK
ncbi:DUF1643 domain-containing protein [Lysinibacillus sp. NPDC047702]|uniref:DUF1643 domain-containing protein n=1 Tax=unclassified Lysinibacillus TaxID=2636778 RepID=UPI003D0064A3